MSKFEDKLLSDLHVLETSESALSEVSDNWFRTFLVEGTSTGTVDAFKEWCQPYEEKYKSATGEDRMPNRWRSAKSVAKRAIELGVEVYDNAGSPVGKTEMQARIKREKEARKNPVTPRDALLQALNRAAANAHEQGMTFDEIADVFHGVLVGVGGKSVASS